MAYKKVTTIVKGRVRRRLAWRRRPGPGAAARYRKVNRMGSPTFTETVALATINTGTTGTYAELLKVSMDMIPQYTDYQNLYNQFCIRSAQFILMPEYDQYDANNSSAAAVAAVTAPRFVYAINDSAQQATPTTEADVLSNNGCKIRMLDKPFRIRCSPVAQVGLTDSNANLVYESKRNRWLSFGVASTAHVGVAYALTQTNPNTTLALPGVKVYAKITFSLRDPK